MSDILPDPGDNGPGLASEAHTSMWDSLAAQAPLFGATSNLSRIGDYQRAEHGDFSFAAQVGRLQSRIASGATPDEAAAETARESQSRNLSPDFQPADVPIAEARIRINQEGLQGQITLPDQPSVKAPVLEMMIQDAHEARDREAAIARGPHGFFPGALGYATSLGVGMIDPLNIAAFSIPVLPEARVASLIAKAGDSMLARGGVKFGIGAAQGAVGSAALEPADWWLHTRDGQDYTMAQALQSVVMGAGMGGLFHAGAGVLGDIGARRRGAPLPGSPADVVTRALQGLPPLDADGAPLQDQPAMPEQLPGVATPHPLAEAIADLPLAAKQDVLRSAIASAIDGTGPRTAEMIEIAADHDPRIAEIIPRKGQDATSWREGPEELSAAIDDLVADRSPQNRSVVLGPVTNERAEQVAGIHGIDVTGFRHVIDNYAIRHTLKMHGNAETEIPRGQLPITSDDFAHVPEIVAAPDRIESAGHDPRGAPLIRYAKQIGDTYYYVDAARSGRRELAMSTMYKRRGKDGAGPEPDAANGSPGLTSEAGGSDSARRAARPDAADGTAGPRDSTSETFGRSGQNIEPDAGAGNARVPDLAGRGGGTTESPADRGPAHSPVPPESGEPGSRIRDVSDDNNAVSDRASRLAAAAADPRWRELADVKPDFDQPDVLEESRAADHVEEPASTGAPERALTALEQEARRVEEIWKQIEPTLTEEERAMVNDVLDQLKSDKEARDKIITDGVACLLGAIG